MPIDSRRSWGSGIAAAALLVLAACAVTPHAERRAMQAELRSQRSRMMQMMELAAQAYLSREDELTCPRVLSAHPKIECFAVPVPISHLTQNAVYLIETDADAREQVLAIRGTANLADAVTDLGTSKGWDPYLEVPVHSGFASFAQTIFEDVERNHRLNPADRIFVTGHSLGGAAALLVGLYLYVDAKVDYDVAGVYTFGQPKVFDNRGTTSWPFFARRVFRVVDCDDVVPIVPTASGKLESVLKVSLFANARLSDYQHMGQSVVLMDNGEFWMPGIELERSLGANIQDTLVDLLRGQPIDHSISRYRARMGALPKPPLEPDPVDPATAFHCSRVAPPTAQAMVH